MVRGLLKSNSSLEKIESELAKLCGHAKSGYPEYVVRQSLPFLP